MSSTFTTDLADAIVAAIGEGCSLADACRGVDVPYETVRSWIKRGNREEGTPFAEFAAEVAEAREDAALIPMTHAEFRRHLDKAVRGGSVQAMRLWWQLEQVRDDAENPFSELDAAAELDALGRLAEQRRARIAALPRPTLERSAHHE